MSRSSARFLVLLILFAALGLRGAAAVWWQSRRPVDQPFAFADSHSYWQLAGRVAHGEKYEHPNHYGKVFRTPGYPVVLAGLFLIRDEPPVLWARLLGAVLGTLAVGEVIWLGRLLFDDTSAYLAGGLAALYPGAVASSIFVLSEAPFCALLVAQLAAWVSAQRGSTAGRRVAWSAVAGIAAGLATLMRPSWLLFTPLAVLISWCWPVREPSEFGGRKRQLQIGMVMLAALLVTMLPWWVRNYRVTGHFVPTSLQVGASLYDGLNPRATGASNMWFTGEFHQQQLREDGLADPPPVADFEVRLDRRIRNAALDWARDNPRRALWLVAVKFQRMWNLWPNAEDLRSWPLRLVVAAGYVPILMTALWGCWKCRRRAWPYWLVMAPAVYLTALHVVFVSSIRYRQPAVLVMCVLSGAVLAAWFAGRTLQPNQAGQT